MNYKIVISICLLSLFMFIFPITEYVFIYDSNVGNQDFIIFIFSQLISIVFAVYVSFKINALNIVHNYSLESIQKGSFILGVMFFIIFFMFVLKNVSSIDGLLFFSEGYRNGVYRGSGLYTAGIVQLLPLIISLMLVKEKSLSKYFYLSLFLVFAASFILGIRVFLFIIFFFMVIRLFTSNGNVLKSIIVMLLFGAFMFSFKYFLNENVKNLSFLDSILHITSRTGYRNIVYDSNFSLIYDFFKGLPVVKYFYSCDTECIKFEYVRQLPDIDKKMPYIGNYSGVALPVTVIIYNMFGFFGFIITAALIIVFFILLNITYSSKKQLHSICALVGTYYIYAMLCEDVNYIFKLGDAILLVTLVIFFQFFVKRFV